MTKRVFKASDGTELRLRAVSNFAVQKIERDWRKHKPKPPRIEILIPGTTDKFRHEANMEDPEYIEALRAWEEDKGTAIAQYLFTAGVENEPEEEFIAVHTEEFPDSTPKEIKFFWVSSKATAQEDNERLMNLIMGINMITPEGVAQAEERFPDNGKSQPDLELQVSGPGDN